MDQLTRFSQNSRAYIYILLLLSNVAMVGGGYALYRYTEMDMLLIFCGMLLLGMILPLVMLWVITLMYIRPLRTLWQAILFVAPNGTGVPAPDLSRLGSAKELLSNLVNHIYQLADMGHQMAASHSGAEAAQAAQSIALQQLPSPLIMLDNQGAIMYMNDAAQQYLETTLDAMQGKPLMASMDISFQSGDTLENWLTHVRASEVRASESWERVKLTTPAKPDEVRYVDIVAGYYKDNPHGYEVMLVLADHTATYAGDDQTVSFIAMAVHEMRTPLTVLRGYVEALHDELSALASTKPELLAYLQRAEASGQQMTSFVSNILNVSRVEDGQLVLQLDEASWPETLQQIVHDYDLRAQTRQIQLQLKIADKLPTVGIDRISIAQVLGNIIENAIKYSPPNTNIVIDTHQAGNGKIETTVTDHGPGIPASSIPRLFDKFYRDHHNKNRVSGTGLGLYLSKTLVNAHGGEIWVNTKEGQGASFGFSILPYSELAIEQKDRNTKGITRTAHGWIKNHSIYRG